MLYTRCAISVGDTRVEQLPLFLDLTSRSCLLVGAGSVAERKARLLLRAGAELKVVAPHMNDWFETLDPHTSAHKIDLIRTGFTASMCDGQHLVIAATGIDRVDRAVKSAADARGLWCNVVDRPDISTALFPAIVDRHPVTIAIGTGGTSPTLARRIKQQIEALLPARLGVLARQLGHWRTEVKRRIKALDERRGFWEKLLSGPIPNHLLAGRETHARRAFKQLLGTGRVFSGEGEAWLVGAGPGDAGLMTLRGHQLLAQADIVLHDALVSEAVLDLARRDAKRVCVGKAPGESHTQRDVTRMLVRLVRKGYKVCRLKGGDPLIFGRGGEEARALSAANLPFEIVPGISAVQGCAASAGIPLTYRGVSSRIILATGVIEQGGVPSFAACADSDQTLALYMSMHRLRATARQLIAAGASAATPAILVEQGTTPDERVLEGTLADIADIGEAHGIRSPAMLFVGDSLKLRSPPTERAHEHSPVSLPEAVSA